MVNIKLTYKWALLGLALLVALTSCGQSGAANQRSEDLLPFAAAIGSSAAAVLEQEGRAADDEVDFGPLAFFEYDRTWQGFEGRTRYLYLRADDFIVAIGFQIPMTDATTVDRLMNLLESLYERGTVARYQELFGLTQEEAERFYAGPVHQGIFFIENYLVEVEISEVDEMINLVFSSLELQAPSTLDYDYDEEYDYEADGESGDS